MPSTKSNTPRSKSKKASAKKSAAKKSPKKAAQKASKKKASTTARKAATSSKVATKTTAKTTGPKKEIRKGPTTEVTPDVLEFIRALDDYKKDQNRPFPTWSEVLEVIKKLGYRKS